MGKNFLDFFVDTFKSFDWIITQNTDSITQNKTTKKFIIKTSIKTIIKLYSKSINVSRDLKMELLKNELSPLYPSIFKKSSKSVYIPGTISTIISSSILSKLSEDDKEALDKFIPDYLAKESVSSGSKLNAKTQIKTLKKISDEIKLGIKGKHTESWWQEYIKNNALIILPGYLQTISKLNIGLGGTKYPDFLLITHDSFLDILEIKRPGTKLLNEDPGRKNFYWDTEISKAIIQVENYIELIIKDSDSLRSYIKDTFKIDLKIIRPRGIILAGNSNQLESQKMKDDYRLLTQANKNINFLTYDELAVRLENYINVLNSYSKS